MYVGLGIALLVIGLILALGVITVDINFIDGSALGAILILGGLLAIGLSLYLSPPTWRRSTVVHKHRHDTYGDTYDDGPIR